MTLGHITGKKILINHNDPVHFNTTYRFYGPIRKEDVMEILQQAVFSKVDIIKTENLYEFDGVRGYSLRQGQ